MQHQGATQNGVAPRAATPGRLLREKPASRRSKEDSSFDLGASFAEHSDALFTFALNSLGDRGEAADCVQDAFIRAWRNRESRDGSRRSVRGWLFAITRTLVLDAQRARARRPVPSDFPQIEWASEPVTEDRLILERLVLYAGLARLTAEHREVISAVQLDGWSYRDLSERTGIPVATLRTRMYYGLRALRTVLEGDAPDEHGQQAHRIKE